MSPPVRARLRRLRFALLGLAATVVILLGVAAGVVQLMLPWLERHPEQVEHWLAERLQRPVRIGHVDGAWIGGGPVLALEDVHIGPPSGGARVFSIPRAELAFDPWALFSRDHATSEFRMAGLELTLVNEDGNWRARDLQLGDTGSPGTFSMGALGAVEIRSLKLTIEDARNGRQHELEVPVLRLLNHGRTTRVLGRARLAGSDSPLLDLVADLDFAARSGEVYAGGRDIDLAEFAAQPWPGGVQPVGGTGAVQLWARVRDARIDDVRARVDLAGASFAAGEPVEVDAAATVLPRVGFERLAFVARWLRDARGWKLDLADVVAGAVDTPPGRATLERGGEPEAPHWLAAAADLQLRPWGDLAMLAGQLPQDARRWLYSARPHGVLARATLDWRTRDDFELAASLRGAGIAPGGSVPGIERIDVDLRGDAAALLFELPTQALRVDYPHLFRRPFVFSAFGGDVVAHRIDDGWQLGTDALAFEGEGYGGELRGSVDLVRDRRPRVDLQAVATHGEVVAAKLFWPLRTMSPKAMGWLDRALVGGSVSGRAAVRGDLEDWPFRNHAGLFIAQADVRDATLDYHEEWPQAEHIEATARFINTGLDVQASSLATMDIKVGPAHAAIGDFGDALLDLEAKGQGSGASLLRFLRATPVGRRFREQIEGLAIGGRGDVTFKMALPIARSNEVVLEGNVTLRDAKIDLPRYDLHFTGASGPLRFTRDGFTADALDVGFRERDARLSVAIGSHAADPRHAFEARLDGAWPVAAVFADVPVLLPFVDRFPGDAVWRAQLAIEVDATDRAGRARLGLDSDLRGIAIELPAPLAKPAAQALPFRLDLELPAAGRPFTASLGNLLAANGVLPGADRPFAARLEFGTAAAAQPPPAQGITIGGRTPVLDAGAWLDLAVGGAGTTSGLVRAVDVEAADFQLASRHFADMRVGIEADADATQLRFDGEALSGTIEIPAANLVGRGIRADFARVHWPEPPPDTPDAGAFTQVAPAALPPLHIAIGDFRLGSASFGAAQFESTPYPGGMRIDRLAAQSPNISMSASGHWTGAASNSRSQLVIELVAQNLGQMMDALGFPGLIDGGDTRATIDASFAGPPSAFALAKLDGTLAIEVGEGRILDVEPGAGRIFGLFSLTEIPRRLSLDFSDFFRSGLSFNSISGRFRLADGNAWTDDLKIESPAADVLVTGRTGLRAKDYDQYMDVTPHAGATLPIVGAIAAGPVGAAAGLVMQGILNKPIGKAVERRYHVTGSWENPEIIQLARSRAGTPQRPSPSEAGAPEPTAELPESPSGIPAPEQDEAPWMVLPEPDALHRSRL